MTVAYINPFKSAHVLQLGNSNELHIVDIEDIDDDLKQCFDAKFIKICEGNSGTDLSLVKLRLRNFLGSKRGTTTELGAIAEFIVHQYLNEIGFEPQFLYFNLEEQSIKKGFDGYYFLNGEEWIFESKSGSITTQTISHPAKIREAYSDLKDKVAGKANNNPWQNAYQHASQIDVGAVTTVRQNIKALSDQYLKGVYYDVKDFNIIPGSTIFLDGSWVASDLVNLESQVKTLVEALDFKRIKVICVTKKSLQAFLTYLSVS